MEMNSNKSMWEYIPDGIGAALITRLEAAGQDMRNLRLVSCFWKETVDSNITMISAQLQPDQTGENEVSRKNHADSEEIILSLLPRLKSIDVLDVSDLQVSEQLLQGLSDKTHLRTLQVCAESAGTSLSNDALDALGKLKSLDNIMLSFHPGMERKRQTRSFTWFKGERLACALQSTPGPKFAAICFCSRAEDEEEYRDAVDDAIKVLQSCPKRLQELQFWGCLVSVAHLHSLQPFESLSAIIDLENFWTGGNYLNGWTAEMLQALRPLRSLRKLTIPCRMQEVAAKQLLPQVQDWSGSVFGYRAELFIDSDDDNSSQDSFDGEQLDTVVAY